MRIPGQDYGSVLRFQSQRDEQQAYFNRNYHNLTTLATYFVDEGTDGIENWVQHSTCLSTISYDKNPSNDLYEAEEYLLSHIQKEKGEHSVEQGTETNQQPQANSKEKTT